MDKDKEMVEARGFSYWGTWIILACITLIAIVPAACTYFTSSAPTTPASLPVVSTTASSSNSSISFIFPRAGSGVAITLFSLLTSATSTIDMAIYSVTLETVKAALLKEKLEGTRIRIITDDQQSGSKYQEALLNQLKLAGIPIKKNKHSGLMHLKMSIIDSRVVTTGSYNYSTAAETTNDEVFVIVTDPVAIQKSQVEFERLWNSSGFEDY